MSTLTARSAPRTIIGLLAALGLMAALTMPALGARTVTHIEGNENKTCGQLGDYGFEFKIDETPSGFYDENDSAVKVTPDVATDFEVTITPGAGNTFSFTANYAVEAVFVKGGNEGGNLYEYSPAVFSDSGLQTPSGQQISHISLCWTTAPGEEPTPTPTPTEEPTPTPTEEPTPTPTPTPTEEPTPTPTDEVEESTPTPTIREDTQGGNPTPSGGTLPNTAVGQFGQIPATVLSLVLLGALAATVYVRLARQR